MKHLKRLFVALICLSMAVCVFLPVDARADVGPNDGDYACAYIIAGDDNDISSFAYLYDGICDQLRQYYSSDTGVQIKGASYDKKTNTLKLDNVSVPHLEANEMGEDFTIELTGNNTIDLIYIWGFGYGGSVTFTGNGSITCRNIYMEAEKCNSFFKVDGNATVKIVNDDSTAFYLNDTYVKNAIQAKYDSEIKATEIPNAKYEMIETVDGNAVNTVTYQLVTKGGVSYYVVGVQYYDDVVADFVMEFELYSIDGNKRTFLNKYATQEDIVADGYEIVRDASTYSYICYESSITFTADKGAAVKGDVFTVSGATYTVTKAGTESAAGTVEFSKPKAGASSVTIPATVTSDGIKYKVTSISANAFSGNKSVKKVTIGKNVKTIGKKAFYNCSKLTTVKISSTKLTEKNVKAYSFKGVNSKCVITTPSAKTELYRTVLKKAGLSSKATVK